MSGKESVYGGYYLPPKPQRGIAKWMAALSFAPLLWLGAFYFFVLRTYWVVGYWPLPNSPDPHNLSFEIHYFTVLFGLGWVPIAGFALVLLAAWEIWREKFHDAFTSLVVYFLSLTGVVAVLQKDTARFLEWFLG